MAKQNGQKILIGETTFILPERKVTGEYIQPMLGEKYYKIGHFDAMAPFFMSLISSSNLWMFLSSTGGLTAGRVSAEQPLFPYYTDDKLTENYENTGNKAILLVTRGSQTSLWEPFSERYQGNYHVERNIYKNVAGTTVVFEEKNLSLGIAYQYAWRTSDAYGFVKTTWLKNFEKTPCRVELLDGLQNLMPAHAQTAVQNTMSPLLDAYKRNEVDAATGLAIIALNATMTDTPEPSESLLATTVFQLGLDQAEYLVSSRQLDSFRAGLGVVPESEARGLRGSYFIHAKLELAAGTERAWHIVADVSQDSVAIVRLIHALKADRAKLAETIVADTARNTFRLEEIVADSDGMQLSRDPLCTAHHFANVMFNVMRGGIFINQYKIEKQDLLDFLSLRNKKILGEQAAFFANIPAETDLRELLALADQSGNADLIRLCYSYLPLSFSRRHGDPSRPWNRFAIDIRKPDGTPKSGYEGNWRDIFQNWEALACSYPEYIESMICTFLNATTVDGYNPYRITRNGIDWEVPDIHDPWSNIGYWSDHQIIYLQKLMEISAKVHPGKLRGFLSQKIFSYANIPFQIKPYEEMLKDPNRTITFNWDLERKIAPLVKEVGMDGKLILRQSSVVHVTLAEKFLTLLLAKLTNFVPEGGIWMNTQRPEWNDANNALVGQGLSVVTLCYLRRYVAFCRSLLAESGLANVQIHKEVQQYYAQIDHILRNEKGTLTGSFTDEQRRSLMDSLGQAGSAYRAKYYSEGLQNELADQSVAELVAFLDLTLEFIEHSLRANKRPDALYHAYNILHIGKNTATVGKLYEMLEGQVAILSSGMLTGAESLALLENMRRGPLFRADQHSYILYPDRKLPTFLERNRIRPEHVKGWKLVEELEKAKDTSLLARDEDGNFHFHGDLHNIRGVVQRLEALKQQPRFAALVEAEGQKVETLFEDLFRHAEFTGRSGTFFAYEGLGSIYWHMVSKLLLAIQETIIRTRKEPSTKGLLDFYSDVRKGLSFNKPPDEYGAFPTDPYSHTPKGQGAKQPGMTGMVKEEILTRQMELGYSIADGCLVFDFLMLDRKEYLAEQAEFLYFDIHGKQQRLSVQPGALAYSICQVPIVLTNAKEEKITLQFSNGQEQEISGHIVDRANSQHIFQRDGAVRSVMVSCKQ